MSTRLEQLQAASVAACDRAIEAISEYKHALQRSQQVRSDAEEIDEVLDLAEQAINAATTSTVEEKKQRAGAGVYHQLKSLKDEYKSAMTGAQIERHVALTTRLLVELFDMKAEDIDLGKV